MHPQITIEGLYRRLIPSKFPTIDIYERFGGREMQAFAAELEAVTNPRLTAKSRITGGDISADSGSTRLQNWNHAPFSYPMPEGSYFLPAPYSVMELAFDERAALARAVLRREQFLSQTDELTCGVDMRMLTHRIKGEFVDLRGLPADTSQKARRLLGKQLFEDGAQGIVHHMAELPGHDFLCVFTSEALVEKATQGAHFRFRWDGNQINRIFDFSSNADIDRSELFAAPKAAA
ncbi:RES family NAD+ phosphorylase [Mesorhizobium sp. B2-4-8]|uniref:RES family NAD+ phosphorylase n=1 Tax=Mesorhizobium sp. B2-4-8 TaxID=2589941 RepID=UPI001126DACF|nr:RES family NAD+ phosphorylase [Mesorhizobium sp. B2-4-8]TPL29536.1 RES domain-containing protein [Mesorhizobium sp. B2-4-8]